MGLRGEKDEENISPIYFHGGLPEKSFVVKKCQEIPQSRWGPAYPGAKTISPADLMPAFVVRESLSGKKEEVSWGLQGV
jgi:hypothetical protein